MKLLAEMMADLEGGHPGCLVASFCYQDQLFNRDVQEMARTGVRRWRELLRERLQKVAAIHPPRGPIEIDDLADMANALIDGGIIISKILKDREILPRQIMLYREFVRGVFPRRPEGEHPGRAAATVRLG